MRGSSLLAPVREFFLLERAVGAAAAITPAQRARLAELRAAADARVAAAGRASTLAACELLRGAVVLLARARAAGRDAGVDEAALVRVDASVEVPELGPDRLDGTTGDAQRVREALAAADPLYLDRLDPAALDRLRIALDRAAGALRSSMEARSATHLRAQRWGRIAAVVLVALYAAWLGVRRHVLPVNIAVGKPVHVSSHHVNPPDGHELVDGRPGFTFGVHTDTEDSPNVVIDLLADYAIDRIAVYNRSDGWWDDCLPLVVELSRDGRTYTELARRETHFGFEVPWSIDAGGRMTRYVRLRVARRSYLALGRVEVFGRRP